MKINRYILKLAVYIAACLLLMQACKKKDSTGDPIPTYHKNGEVKPLYFKNPAGVNMVILGDGFIHDDLKMGGLFDTKVDMLVSYFFSVSPYKQNINNFNTYIVYAESQNRGATQGFQPGNSKTKFSSFFDLQTTRLLQAGNFDSVYNYVEKAIPLSKANIIVVLVNDDTYGGSGGKIAVVSTNSFSRYVMVHEIGHSFGNLGDEYIDPSIVDTHPVDRVQDLPNIDGTNDLTKIKWAHFLNLYFYKTVNAYSGAYYRSNYYRPELGSIMSDLGYTNYNAPSREAIVRKINGILNIPFDFNAFLQTDSLSVPRVASSPQQNFSTSATYQPIRPPDNDFIGLKEKITPQKSKNGIQ